MYLWLEQAVKVTFQQVQFIHSQLSMLTWVLIGSFLLFFLMLLCFSTYYLNNEIREVKWDQTRRSTRKTNFKKRVNSCDSNPSKKLQLSVGVVDSNPNTSHMTMHQLLDEIHYAACKSNAEQWAMRCIKLLQHYPKAVNHAMQPQNFTPFLRACSCGGIFLVKYMLLNGADVSYKTADGDTAMILAVYSVSHSPDDFSLLELLLKYGCNINEPKHNGCTPLHMAAKSGNLKLIWWLIDHGANPMAKSDQGWTPAHIAEALKHGNVAKFLSKSFPDITH